MCVGTRPPTLQALMKGTYAAPKLTIVTVGTRPPIAAFEVDSAPPSWPSAAPQVHHRHARGVRICLVKYAVCCAWTEPIQHETQDAGGALTPAQMSVPIKSTQVVRCQIKIAHAQVEERAQRGAIAMVSDIAQSLKGWIPRWAR